MPDTEPQLASLLAELLDTDTDTPLHARAEMAQLYRRNRERSLRLDQTLIAELLRLRQGLAATRARQEELRRYVESLVAPPLFTATLLRLVRTETDGLRAVVFHGGVRRVIAIAANLDPARLHDGDEVYLSEKLNVVVDVAPNGPPEYGETAAFERWAGDGRAVLRARDEELIVNLAHALRAQPLAAGDLLRWDRSSYMAFEKLERSRGTHLFLDEMPAETFESIGGLDRQIAALRRVFELRMEHAGVLARYGVPPKSGCLLYGPPGTGKTLVARAACNWLGTRSPSGRAAFMYIKPAALHSVWYSQSEANYREAFRVAREAAAADPQRPVVMYFDELDAIGTVRGESANHVDDRICNTVMAELDGLGSRGNVFVLGSTNRRSALDPGFVRPRRFGDLVLEIPRPNRAAAREIFARHVPAHVPFAGPRDEAIEAALSRLYAPNGDGEVATLVFRDGTRRPLRAADLISGADIALSAADALERACVREVDTGSAGVRAEDLIGAALAQLHSVAAALTARNCRHYVQSLREDLDVVNVERPARKAAARHAVLEAA